MNLKTVTFLVVLFSTALVLEAKTIRVNADVGSDPAAGIYATLEMAHNAASDGDILLVDGAVNTYAGFTCTKRLTIIGPGYFLAENNMPQRNPNSATVAGKIRFDKGSDGSVVSGMVFANNISARIEIATDGITIKQNYLGYGVDLVEDITSALIVQNYLGFVSASRTVNVSGVILKNNIIHRNMSFLPLPDYSVVLAHVEHNVFVNDVRLAADNFRNNIVLGSATITSTNIRNNLGSALADGETNIAFDDNRLFVGLNDANDSPDGQYRLKADSPYRESGQDNAEPGIFGGDMPYVISGLSGIPSIYVLETDATTTRERGLHVEVKAKTNP